MMRSPTTLAKLGRSGVPAYALYVPGEASPRLLPEVLTPGIVTEAIAGLPKVRRVSRQWRQRATQ